MLSLQLRALKPLLSNSKLFLGGSNAAISSHTVTSSSVLREGIGQYLCCNCFLKALPVFRTSCTSQRYRETASGLKTLPYEQTQRRK